MDEKQKAAIVVGSKVRLRDGREGNVTEVKDNQVVVTVGDGSSVEVAVDEAEAIEGEGQGAA